MSEKPDRPKRPDSATSMWINWLALAATAAAWYFCHTRGLPMFQTALLTIVAYAGTMIVLEVVFLKTPTRVTTGIDWKSFGADDTRGFVLKTVAFFGVLSLAMSGAWRLLGGPFVTNYWEVVVIVVVILAIQIPYFCFDRRVHSGRVLLKTIGFYGTLAVVAFAYWLVHQYHGNFFNNYWRAIKYVLPFILIIQIPYFAFVDGRMRDPEDGYAMFGGWLLGQRRGLDSQTLRQHFLGWTVKGFFLPIMFADYINLLAHVPFRATNFITFFDWAYNAVFTVDLLIVTVGYVFTLRIFDSHIRSTEPSMTGWVVAIMCYPPFWGGIYNSVLPYDDKFTWGPWLRDGDRDPVTLFGIDMGTNIETVLWGSAILLCGYIYSWASLAFGLRFSNLTHRGILTNGPYRLTKHPAYVFKNISWWLIAIPFVANSGPETAVRQCLMLLVVNFIYYMRARTEERHLSHDPDYVNYALYMNRASIFAPLAAVLPFLKYRQPQPIPGFSLKV